MPVHKKVNASMQIGVGALKPMKVLKVKTGRSTMMDNVTQGSFGIKRGNKIDIREARASKTHSS